MVCAGKEAAEGSQAQWPAGLASRPVKEPVSKDVDVARGITPQLVLESERYAWMCICPPPPDTQGGGQRFLVRVKKRSLMKSGLKELLGRLSRIRNCSTITRKAVRLLCSSCPVIKRDRRAVCVITLASFSPHLHPIVGGPGLTRVTRFLSRAMKTKG